MLDTGVGAHSSHTPSLPPQAMPTQTLNFSTADDSEELARAELYGLLARLWLAPPDAALREQFDVAVTQAPQPGAFLEGPWQTLVAAMRTTTPQQAAEEYDALFLGVGKPEVFLYGSFYLTGFLNEKPLAQLRDELTKMGLARSGNRHETEDHVSALCDVMRFLIAGDADTPPAALDLQHEFFRRHIEPWYAGLATVIIGANQTNFYKHVAHFMREFFAIENAAFDIT